MWSPENYRHFPRLQDIVRLSRITVYVINRGSTVLITGPPCAHHPFFLGRPPICRIFFVTNNSTKSRKGYKSKFDSLGLVRAALRSPRGVCRIVDLVVDVPMYFLDVLLFR